VETRRERGVRPMENIFIKYFGPSSVARISPTFLSYIFVHEQFCIGILSNTRTGPTKKH
jgi:hypothetical protein